MSFTSTDVNALIWRYLMEAGFTHSAYTFSNESQVTKTYTEMAQIAPGSLIRFLYKGIQFTEIEANLKEDKSSVEELYKVVNARDMITMDSKEVKEHVQASRAEDEESSDQEPAAPPQQAKQAPEAKVSKAKRGRKTANGLQQSPVRQAAVNDQPAQPSQQSAERINQAQPSSHRSQQQAAELRDAQTPKPPAKVLQPRRAHVTVLDTQSRESRMCLWSPTDAVLASGLGDSEALLWRQPESAAAPSEGYSPTVLSHKRPDSDKSCDIECLDWNASGTILATGSIDGLICLWESTGQPKSTLKGHKSAVNCLRFSKTADILLSGSVDKAAIVWTEGIQTHVVTQHSGSVCCVAWKNDHYFATGSADHVIYIHHGDQTQSTPLRGADPDLTHLEWSPDGDYLVSCCEGGVIAVWNPEQGSLLHRLKEHTADIEAVQWSPQAPLPHQHHLLATASQDHTIRLWDVASGSCVHKLTFTDKVRSLAFHADGAYLIAGGDGGDVTIWSVAAAKQVLSVPCHGPISSVACHTASNVVAAASFRSKRIYMITIAMD